MIDEDMRAKIRRLYYADHYKIHSISECMGVHRSTIQRVLRNDKQIAPKRDRTSKLDPFGQIIEEHLAIHSKLRAPRLLQILQDRGYTGGVGLIRSKIRELRPRFKKPYMRMIAHIGEQAQVDWAHCGELKIGSAKRKLYLFVMVLSYSRAIYAKFCVNLNTSTFLRCHEDAFKYFGGIPRVILYDNLKSVVIARRGNLIRFNDDILEFSGFYGFEPRPCSPYRGNEKGRVERTIRYLRDNFLAARSLTNLDAINSNIYEWCERIGNRRPWPGDRNLRVKDKWMEEKGKLLRLSDRWLNPKEQHISRSGKTPWINFDLNSYSIPPEFVGRSVSTEADDLMVKILSEGTVIASHVRSYDRNRFVEDKKHVDQLIKHKRFGRGALFRESIIKEYPQLEGLLEKLFAQGADVNSTVRKLYKLKHQFGRDIFETTINAFKDGKFTSIQMLTLSMINHQRSLKVPPSIPIELPNNQVIREMTINSHPLENYDIL